MYQTALQLQQTDFTSEKETEEAVNRLKEIVMLFDGHAHKEDKFVLPAIEAYEPSVVATFQAEHVKDEALGQQLNECIDRQLSATTLIEKITLGTRLTEAFIEFMVFNLEHMAKEEDIINKILWRYYSDDEIKKISGQIVQATPPWMQAFYFSWMLRGISNPEAVNWMKSIEKTMPALVFQSLLQKAEEELTETRFRQLTSSLTEGVQLA